MTSIIKIGLFLQIPLLLLIWTLGSSSGNKLNETSVIGCYNTVQKSRLFKFLHTGFYPSGFELQIASDSSFKFSTCGNLVEGKWTISSDSLILNSSSNLYKIDSLNSILPEMGPLCLSFRIAKGGLQNISKRQYENQVYNDYIFLKKINDSCVIN